MTSIDGRPVEEVLFLRDEMANLAWAVERRVESPIGAPLDRYEDYVARQRAADTALQPPIAAGTMRYRVATEVPDYWVPLLPVRVGQGLRLQRGAVLKIDGSQAVVESRGRILDVSITSALTHANWRARRTSLGNREIAPLSITSASVEAG